MSSSAVETRGLCACHGSHEVLHELCLTVATGEFLAIVGPSGCGKTTLLRCLAGFHAPSSGEIRFGGSLLAGNGTLLPPERRRVGMVFQSYALWPHMTAMENVAYPWKMGGLGKREAQERAGALLDSVGLHGLEKRRPNALSGGQQQRVAIARALAGEPQLLLLDEPFSSVDAAQRQSLQDLMLDIARGRALTTVLATHDQAEAFALADRIAVLRAGRLEQVGPAVELYERPNTAFVARFVGVNNLILVSFLPSQTAETLVVLPDGQRTTVTAKPPCGKTEALLCVRPAEIALTSDGRGFNGTIVAAALRDGYSDYRVDAGGVELRVWEPGLPARARGERVTVALGAVRFLGADQPEDPA